MSKRTLLLVLLVFAFLLAGIAIPGASLAKDNLVPQEAIPQTSALAPAAQLSDCGTSITHPTLAGWTGSVCASN